MIKKNNIRKIILEELIKKLDRNFLVSEQSSGGGPWVSGGQAGGAKSSVEQAIQKSQIKGNAEDLLYQLEQFQKKSDDEKIKYITGGVNGNLFLDLFESDLDAIMNVVVISEADAKKYAGELIAATLEFEDPLVSGSIKTAANAVKSAAAAVGISTPEKPLKQQLGLGTDEDKIKTIINNKDIRSQLSFSRVCLEFSKLAPNSKSFYDVFQDELDLPGDEEEFVLEPIRGLSFIRLQDERTAVRGLTIEELIEDIRLNTFGISPEGEKEIQDLDFGLEAPYIKNIIKTMNSYAKRESLQGYTQVEPVDRWNEEVQPAWLKFAPHVLNNCSLYSEFTPDKIGGVASWPAMSAKMSPKYPGYTPNPRGCLAFCLDGYYCELRYGDKAPSKGGKSGGGSGRPRTEDERRPKQSREIQSEKVTISLNLTNKNFKSSGFKLKSGGDPDNLFVEAILNQMSNETKAKGYRGGQLNIYLNLRGTGLDRKVTNIEVQRGGGKFQGFDLILRNLKDRLKSIAQGLIFPEKGPYSADGLFDKEKGLGRQESILMTVVIPSAGDIEDLRP